VLPARAISRGSKLRKKKRSALSQSESGEMSLGFRELNTASRGGSELRPPLPKRTAGQERIIPFDSIATRQAVIGEKPAAKSFGLSGGEFSKSSLPLFTKGGKFSHLYTLTPVSRNASACFRQFSHRLAFRAGKDSCIHERKSPSVRTPAPAIRLNRRCCSTPCIFNRVIKALAARTQ